MTSNQEIGYRKKLVNLTAPKNLGWILNHETANAHSKLLIELYNTPETIQPAPLTVGEYAKKFLKK